MPWRMEYFAAPQDETLTVHKAESVTDLPPGYEPAIGLRLEAQLKREFWGQGKPMFMHYCEKCGGWIEGEARRYGENTIGPLCGRRGHSYHCRRCGREIAFWGWLS